MYESLRGATAILTRKPEDNVALRGRLERVGARVIEMPCVHVEALADTRELAAAIAQLGPDDWIVVTSRAGADALVRTGAGRARIAAVGAATAARVANGALVVAFIPTVPTGECLARELPSGRTALLARSDRALPDLPRILRERGFVVREVAAYRTVPGASGDVRAAHDALARGQRVAIFCSSPSAVDGLTGAIAVELLSRATFFVPGDTTARAVRERVGDGARVGTFEEEAAHVAHR